MSGALRLSRKSGSFSPYLKETAGQTGSYTGHFLRRAHIPAVYRAKFAAIRLFRALSAAQGLP
jgi:hypothetical protein